MITNKNDFLTLPQRNKQNIQDPLFVTLDLSRFFDL